MEGKKQQWVSEAKRILIEKYGFNDDLFAQVTAETIYNEALENNELDDWSVQDLIEEEMSNWGD